MSFFLRAKTTVRKGKKTDESKQKNNIEELVLYSSEEDYHRRLSSLTFTTRSKVLKTHVIIIKMGIKGLPEQLKHYYRDAQVEQFKGMNAQSRIFKTTFASSPIWFPVVSRRDIQKLTQRRTIVLFLFTSSSTNRFARTKRIGWNI